MFISKQDFEDPKMKCPEILLGLYSSPSTWLQVLFDVFFRARLKAKMATIKYNQIQPIYQYVISSVSRAMSSYNWADSVCYK